MQEMKNFSLTKISQKTQHRREEKRRKKLHKITEKESRKAKSEKKITYQMEYKHWRKRVSRSRVTGPHPMLFHSSLLSLSISLCAALRRAACCCSCGWTCGVCCMSSLSSDRAYTNKQYFSLPDFDVRRWCRTFQS